MREEKLRPLVFAAKNGKKTKEEIWNDILSNKPTADVVPLDMSQFQHLFQTTRVPKNGIDEIKKFPDAKHVLVIRKGHFYVVPALDDEWMLFPPSYYAKALRRIVQDTPNERADGVGLLTSLNRDTWASLRSKMLSQPRNGAGIDEVESSILTICLDEEWSHNHFTIKSSENTAFGLEPENRWYDKSLSFLVSSNGYTAFFMEHAWGDGVASMACVEEVMADMSKNDFLVNERAEAINSKVPEVKRLKFTLNPELRGAIASAKNDFLEKKHQLSFQIWTFFGLSKVDVARSGISPDALAQAGLQVAYSRVRGRLDPVYESCTTAVFRCGRTETVRPLTKQSK